MFFTDYRDKNFDLLFEEMASIELKKSRKEYEEAKQRQEEAEKAKKEKRSPKKQEDARSVNKQSSSNTVPHPHTSGTYGEEKRRRDLEAFGDVLAKKYNRELISPKPVHTTDLSSIFAQNAFLSHSFVDKVIILFGDIIKIDYDKYEKMPYVLIGTRQPFSSGIYDEYTCYFSLPEEIDAIKRLQVGEMVVICGILSEIKNNYPSRYGLMQSQILASDDE